MSAMPNAAPPSDLETTAVLLDLARAGEQEARNRLARRYLPHLRVFARGRLPVGARSLEETDDVVQVAMIRGFARIEAFQAERRGSFLVYLRVIVDNLIRDRWRSNATRPQQLPLPDDLAQHSASPLDHVVAAEEQTRYRAALERLKPRQRDAVVLRFELDCTYEEIAEELGIASTNAARMRVERGLVRLAQLMAHGSPRP